MMNGHYDIILSVHVQKATEARHARTATEYRALERSYGCKYSVLFELPCFDIVRYHVVDPMHNFVLRFGKAHYKDME